MQNQFAQTATEPGRSNQTSEQFNILERITSENEKMVTELENRLRPVLRELQPSIEKVANQPGPPQEYLVPLANGLRSIYETALRTQRAINGLLERAEI